MRHNLGHSSVGGKPPLPEFGRSVNPNLIQFGFFHPIGYLKINKILFEPNLSDLIQFEPILFDFISFEPNNQYYPTWSDLIQHKPIWSNLIWFDPICTNLIWFDLIWTKLFKLVTKRDKQMSKLVTKFQKWATTTTWQMTRSISKLAYA